MENIELRIIKERNWLISGFMNFEEGENSHFTVILNGKLVANIPPQYMLFNTSWDWLMPVVHSCLKICHENSLNEWENEFIDKFMACDINVMYGITIEFIMWYNSNLLGKV